MENGINDLIIRIKNGYMASLKEVSAPYSHFGNAVAQKLKAKGFIGNVAKKDRLLIIELKYEAGLPSLTGVKIFSKPGQRAYISYKKLKPVLGGLGYAFLSTSKGIMTHVEAKKAKLGGEELFEIW